jgi:UrcA family protein
MNIGKSRARPVIGAAAFVAAACLTGSAFAHDETVRYSDLDINTTAGATTLYQRIVGAASTVCGEQGVGIDARRHWTVCFQSAVSYAVDQVHSPLLTSIARNPKSAAPATAMIHR